MEHAEGPPASTNVYSLATNSELRHRLTLGTTAVDATMPGTATGDTKGSWWRSYLAGERPRPTSGGPVDQVRSVDLFCGPGGLANGLAHLAAELGIRVVTDLVVDQDTEATLVYAANHVARRRSSDSVSKLVDFAVDRGSSGARFGYTPELVDPGLAADLHGVGVVLAGPPCQGHSNLNNQTRRSDPRNSLYLTVPAFAVAIGAPICIVENVPAVLNDSERVVEVATQLFESEGYSTTSGTLTASAMGWPQTRKRHFLIARRDQAPVPLDLVTDLLRDEPRSIWWAIGDLEDTASSDDVMHQRTDLSHENQSRIDWLFDNDAYDLALPERPDSHRGGTSYTAVYGRMYKDRPAPTLTTGFMTPGRGRFTHPTRRRVLTAREAARLQGFPDTYDFIPDPTAPPTRAQLAKWIGDAVPMPLGYAAALSALGPGLPGA